MQSRKSRNRNTSK